MECSSLFVFLLALAIFTCVCVPWFPASNYTIHRLVCLLAWFLPGKINISVQELTQLLAVYYP